MSPVYSPLMSKRGSGGLGEELRVVVRPVVHSTLVDVVCQVIDDLKAAAHGVRIDALEIIEVDVVDAAALFEAIDEVDDGATDPAMAGSAAH